MFDLADVGCVAPALVLRDEEDLRHRPRLLAFVRGWWTDDLSHLRTCMAQLDTELVIISDDIAWLLPPDGEPVFCARVDARAAAASYCVTGDAVFVIDHRGIVRFAHHRDDSLGDRLADALDAATEAMEWRDHQTKLELVQWTQREWAVKSLVVGCSLTFPADRLVEHRRFARGTESVRTLPARELTTPRTEVGAPAPHSNAPGGEPTVPSLRRLV